MPKKYQGKTIKQRPDGQWWTRYYDNNGKQRSVYGSTQNGCLRKLKLKLKELEAEKEQNAKEALPPITLGEWVQQWLELYKIGKVKDSTLYGYTLLSKQLAPLSDTALIDINTIMLQKYLNDITAPRTRERLKVLLGDCLGRAVKLDMIPKNPCDAVVLAKMPKSKRKKALTQAEEIRFVDACMSDRYGMQYLLCLYQGLRIGETKLLTMADFDLDNRTLTIDKAMNDQYKADTPKSETSNRVIPLFKNTLDALDQLGLVVARSDRQVYEHWKSICATANIEGYTVHSLRHTFATRCSEKGIAPKTVQKWLGHSTIDMTLNIYTHINSDFEMCERDKLDGID